MKICGKNEEIDDFVEMEKLIEIFGDFKSC